MCSAVEAIGQAARGELVQSPNWRRRLNTARCAALDAMWLLIDLPRPHALAIHLDARLICQQGWQNSHTARMQQGWVKAW